jgi:glyoxylate carboligase
VDTIRWGSSVVPLLRRRWREAEGVPGFRMVRSMRPGDRWVDLPFNENTYEALVDVDGSSPRTMGGSVGSPTSSVAAAT